MRVLTREELSKQLVMTMVKSKGKMRLKKRQYSINYKRMIVEMHLQNGVKVADLVQVCHACNSSVHNWVKQYKAGHLTLDNAICVSSVPRNVFRVV